LKWSVVRGDHVIVIVPRLVQQRTQQRFPFDLKNFIRNIVLGLTPTFAASLVAGCCFQLLAWFDSYLYLFAGMLAPIPACLAATIFVGGKLWPEPKRIPIAFVLGNLIVSFFAVAALAPPEK
jgi:hypothetical protein